MEQARDQLGEPTQEPEEIRLDTADGLSSAGPDTGATLTGRQRTVLIRMIRVAYPHDRFPDGPYERTAAAVTAAAAAAPESMATLTSGLDALDAGAGGDFLALDEAAATARLETIDSGPFFRQVHGTVVVALYDDREVWRLLGYEGSSFEQGGYLDRGFDDLDWLPEPRITESDEPRIELVPSATAPGSTAPGTVDDGGTAMSSHGKAVDESEAVVVVVGSGAGGGTTAYELATAGVKVVVLEAGPYLTQDDWMNDEWPAFSQMAWLDNRTTSGGWRVATDFPNLPTWIVKAVGGTTTHWAGATPRFLAHEFAARTTYGEIAGANLLDWPVTLPEMEPWYDRAEQALGSTHRHGRPPLPANNNYKVFANGAAKAGFVHYATGPYATNAEPYDGRPASVQDGFNFQGDKNGSKWSTLFREVPRALESGNCELRARCQAVRITHDAAGRADGVEYVDGDGAMHRQAASVVVVAGNSIETPRLLLMSASSQFPDGLANSSGQVGRNYMRHLTGSAYARFDRPVHMYRGETMAGIIADEAKHDPSRGFSGGYYLETLALGPAFLASFVEPGTWGRAFTELMDAYENTAGLWIVGEDMPQESNRVTLSADVTDELGLPVPHVHYDDHPNDLAMRAHGYASADRIYGAVGALGVHHTPPYPSTHNLGTCRMSADPADGVLTSWGRAHDVPNLFVSDGSVMTTGASANPTLTIVALAIRQADHILSELAGGRL